MVKKIIIGLLVLLLTTAAVFSIVKIGGQRSIGEDLRDAEITAALMEKETQQLQAELNSLENEMVTSRAGAGGPPFAGAVEDEQPLMESTVLEGVADQISDREVVLTLNEAEQITVRLENTAPSAVTDFALETGDPVSVTGFWNGAGMFIGESLTNLKNGAVLVINHGEQTNAEQIADAQSGQGGGYGGSGAIQGTGFGAASGGRGYRGGRN